MSDCCWTSVGNISAYIVARTSYISMRWWWCQLCTRSVLLVRMYSCSSLKQQSMTCCCSRTHYSWFKANQSLLLLLNAACLVEKQQLPVLFNIVFSLTWSGLEPSIYRMWGEHANHYTTDVVNHVFKYIKNTCTHHCL